MAKFIRKHLNPFGVHHAVIKTGTDENGNAKIIKEIIIEGREVYSTDDKKEIDYLRADEAVVEVEKEKTNKKEAKE